jgi:hypothetical protein
VIQSCGFRTMRNRLNSRRPQPKCTSSNRISPFKSVCSHSKDINDAWILWCGMCHEGGGQDSMVLGENCERMGSGVQKVLGLQRCQFIYRH